MQDRGLDQEEAGPVSARELAAEYQLRRVNAFLDAIVENIPDMIFVKDAETLLFERFNRAGEELLGYRREELLGKTDHDFYPKEQADFFHEKDRETLRNKTLVDIAEEPIQTKHGLRWLHTKKVPVLDETGRPRYLLGISEDITARKLAEERAHALERELASVVREAREAIISWDLDGRVVAWNPAAEALYGLSESAALGRNIETLVPAGLLTEFRAQQEQLKAGEARSRISDTYRLRGAAEIEIEESQFAIHDGEGKVVRIGSIARDLTELARLRRATEILGGADRPKTEATARSSKMRELLSCADVVAENPLATVLLLGETGVGKSWLARRVHDKSPRVRRPFFEVNCAGLGRELVESELFGHERGAFTGAIQQKRGIVEAAEGGTLFLDEIGELPLPVQAQLLTFLDTRSFRRVGATRVSQADVRLVAATNVDLKAMCDRGLFRRDLYYRLSVVPLVVPPLRERREEIPDLARQLLADLAPRSTRPRMKLDRSVSEALGAYDWPGNVRELKNALERALILSRGAPFGVEHLPAEIRGATRVRPGSAKLEDVERGHILRVLDEAAGNRTRAAEMLGISRSTLKRKLAELSLSA